jgi:G3E family GTPase
MVPTAYVILVLEKGALMKVIILSGFLGAGKTSVLLQMAGYLTGESIDRKPAKVAILENEIGKVSVDGSTLRAQGIEVRDLFAGCVCCTLTGELASALREVEAEVKPDWLIVEATGLAYPDRTADIIREQTINLEKLKIIVLIDAEHFLILDRIVPLISGQPCFADILLLNKTDLADDATRQEIVDRLREINSEAPIFEIVAIEQLPDTLWQEVL